MLACDLMAPLQERRASSSHWYAKATRQILTGLKDLHLKIKGVSGKPVEQIELKQAEKRKRCELCVTEKHQISVINFQSFVAANIPPSFTSAKIVHSKILQYGSKEVHR